MALGWFNFIPKPGQILNTEHFMGGLAIKVSATGMRQIDQYTLPGNRSLSTDIQGWCSMAGGGLPDERSLLVQGGGGEIPCRYKPLSAICNHYNDKHHNLYIKTCRKLHCLTPIN